VTAALHAAHVFVEGAGFDGIGGQFGALFLLLGHRLEHIRLQGDVRGKENQQFSFGLGDGVSAEEQAENRYVAENRDFL